MKAEVLDQAYLQANSSKSGQEILSDKSKLGKSKIRENVEAIIIAIILALFIRTFIVQAFKIPSGSMIPTLQIGDHILVNKFIYGVKIPFTDTNMIPGTTPKHQDIVVFKYPQDPSKDYIKRVVGIEGDIVEIKNKKVYLNNEPIKDAYGFFEDSRIFPGTIQPRDNYGPITVPKNSIFVMGDNRDHSFDSRFWGFVNNSALRGQAFLIYWSWNNDNFSVRFDRIGKILR